MEYRKLGDSDLNLSVITYGSFAIGGTMWGGTEKKEAQEAVRASLDHGVTTLDTAPFYGFGLSEKLIGETIGGMDRSKIQILTKFGMVWDGSNNGKGDFMFDIENEGKIYPIYKFASKANVIKEAEESLKRLGTDYIDLLQLHWFDSTTPVDETMEALQLLIDQGKIRAAGVSNYNNEQMLEAQKSIRLASNQLPYSMLKREIESEVIPAAIKNNVGIIAYSPLERGLLTGKFFKGDTLKSSDHRNGYFAQFDLEKVKSLLERIEPIAQDKGVSLSQLVLRWTTLQPGITAVLAGATNKEQAISNAQATQISLSKKELNFIDDQLAN
ncbi:aldo/keto reductase [Dyadobacter fanqingshengii]|uniref:Aldo/keto reductase n=1 Tax=Dyadobacter fanqingshengii TaxID=2906443 RepID=A0A9X1TFP8_9BACT|nr:aldo/keto reductase [Dyadobacter fanqingshengii]MCF0039727.1 aldo/keto reductase [Dyadobacter fanqingshengii]USJ38510.1 aldo/keto reductase [Dyadobacter fanqingshengii]